MSTSTRATHAFLVGAFLVATAGLEVGGCGDAAAPTGSGGKQDGGGGAASSVPAAGGFGDGPGGGVVTLDVVLKPKAIDADAELVNPLRGFHEWRGADDVPQPAPYPLDGYERYYWADFQKSETEFSFKKLTDDIDAFADPAKNGGIEGRKFSFRLRTMSDGSDGALHVPNFLESCTSSIQHKGNPVNVPKWDDDCFQTPFKKLMGELEAALAPYHDRIGFIDVGVYGQWGEWSLYGYPDEVAAQNPESLQLIIDQHTAHLGWAQLLVFVILDDATVSYAMGLTSGGGSKLAFPIGVRTDCYDCVGFLGAHDKLGAGRPAALLDRWKTAPLLGERGTLAGTNGQTGIDSVTTFHISSLGNSVIEANRTAAELPLYAKAGRAAGYRLGITKAHVTGSRDRLQVALTWSNVGSAPPYEPWRVELSLGETRATADLPNAALLPGAAPTQTFVLGTSKPFSRGSEELVVKLVDPRGGRLPMQLALTEGDAGTGYPLGEITLR